MSDETFVPQGMSAYIDTAPEIPEDSLAGAAATSTVAGIDTANTDLEQTAAEPADNAAEPGVNDSDEVEGEQGEDADEAQANADAETDDAPTIPRERLNAEAQKRREAEERATRLEAELAALKPNAEAAHAEQERQAQAEFERQVEHQAATAATQHLAKTFGNEIVQQMTDEGIAYSPNDATYIAEFNARLQQVRHVQPWVDDLYNKTFEIEKSAAFAQRDNTTRALQSLATEYEFHNPVVLDNFAKNGASPEVLRLVAKDTHEFTAAQVSKVRSEFDAYKADEAKRIEAARAAGKQDALKERTAAENAPRPNGRAAAPPPDGKEWRPTGNYTQYLQEGSTVRL